MSAVAFCLLGTDPLTLHWLILQERNHHKRRADSLATTVEKLLKEKRQLGGHRLLSSVIFFCRVHKLGEGPPCWRCYLAARSVACQPELAARQQCFKHPHIHTSENAEAKTKNKKKKSPRRITDQNDGHDDGKSSRSAAVKEKIKALKKDRLFVFSCYYHYHCCY